MTVSCIFGSARCSAKHLQHLSTFGFAFSFPVHASFPSQLQGHLGIWLRVGVDNGVVHLPPKCCPLAAHFDAHPGVFSWVLTRHLLPASPAAPLRPPGPPAARRSWALRHAPGGFSAAPAAPGRPLLRLRLSRLGWVVGQKWGNPKSKPQWVAPGLKPAAFFGGIILTHRIACRCASAWEVQEVEGDLSFREKVGGSVSWWEGNH